MLTMSRFHPINSLNIHDTNNYSSKSYSIIIYPTIQYYAPHIIFQNDVLKELPWQSLLILQN